MCESCGCGSSDTVPIEELDKISVKTTKPQQVAYAYHKGPFERLGERFEALAKWIAENGYEITGPAITICYNNPQTTPPEELLSEVQFPVKHRSNKC